MKAINKPFVILLNSSDPGNETSVRLAYELQESYDAPVALVNCLELSGDDIRQILEMVLMEFPVTEIGVELPGWTMALEADHWLRKSLYDSVLSSAGNVRKTGDIEEAFETLSESDNIKNADLKNINLGDGTAELCLTLDDELYYKIISELSGLKIDDEVGLVKILGELADVKEKYDKVSTALADVSATGYGIVTPDIYDLKLEEPEIVKQPSGYGVKLKASAPSIHMIRANIETEINPVVGSEQQSEDLVKFLLREFEEDPKRIWESNMFGKSLYELVTEGLHTKLSHMPQESRVKLADTLQRLINEGSGGLICIIL